MSLALSLGRRGQGRVWPNPAVGCIIVKDGRIVGRGWTADGGRPHAEARALAQAAGAAQGATAYVTLEPCAHHGKTPPCAEALVKAGIARVVTAIGDPDSRVAGKGIAMLRAAGIEVVEGVLSQQAEADHAGFLLRVTSGRPFITLKLATSLDGRIATGTGESQWITGSAARRYVHALRASHDAVMVGAGTARADDPQLTVRGLGIEALPIRIVVSRGLDLPADGALAGSAGKVPLWLCHGEQAETGRVKSWTEIGAECLPLPEEDGRVDIAAALAALAARGLTRVFCEGGGGLAASLLAHGLVDRLVVFSAGLAIGAEGLPSLAPMGFGALSKAPRFALSEVTDIGGDVMSVWHRT